MTDLSNCEKEPIHIPGRIQPHGILVVLKEPELTILQISANTIKLLDQAAETFLQQPLALLLGQEQTAKLQEGLNGLDIQLINPLRLSIKTANTMLAFDGTIHRSGNLLLLELEHIASIQHSYGGLYHSLKLIITRLQRAIHLTEMCQVAAEEIRLLTGYDRVMVYQFDEQWNGTVIAENKVEDLDSFLDLRFPASDIPQQARALYELNCLRLIADVDYQPADIVPTENPFTQSPLDLSFATLRSVSPIHIEYLKNMGVHASLCLSLLKEHQLWGMIVCHHRNVMYLNYEMRTACELVAQFISSQLYAKERYEDYIYESKIKTILASLIRNLQKEENIFTGLKKNSQNLLDAVGAQGVVLCIEQEYVEFGSVPPKNQVRQLVSWLQARPEEGLFHTSSLASIFAESHAYKKYGSGLLALPISKIQGSYILWFRPEVIQTVKWGGDPNTPVVFSANDQTLHPRRSFEQWKETIRLKSIPWKECELVVAFELRSILIDITLRDLILKQTLGSWLKS